MKNIKSYVTCPSKPWRSRNAAILATILCAPIYLSAMEPIDGPTTSSESGVEYPTVSLKNKQMLKNKLKELHGSLTMLNELLKTKESEESSSGEKETIIEILRQKNIITKAIELAENMYFGIISVDMNRIQKEMNRLLQ